MKTELFCLGVAVLFLTKETLTQIEPDPYLIEKMSEVRNISQWCELMNMEDCEKVIEEAVTTEAVDETGEKIVVSGDEEEPKVALFDACNPRGQTIALPRHPDPDITVWPPCTRAQRCGGCCTSDVFSCEPTAISEKFVKVFDTRLPYPGAHRFKFLGVRIVKIIEHLHCDAQCKTKEHECHKYQKYDHRRCRCYCRPERLQLKYTCSEDQIWDENECDCICPNRNTIVCPDPSYFSSQTCKCTLKMGVSGEIDLEKLFEQLDRGDFGQDILLNTQTNGEYNDTDIIAGNIIVDEATPPSGKDSSGENAGTNGKVKGKGEDENGNDDEDETTTFSQSSSTSAHSTSAATSTTTATTTKTTTTTTPTTTTTTTTTAPKPTTCVPPKPCWGNWEPRRLKNGKCRCFPAFG